MRKSFNPRGTWANYFGDEDIDLYLSHEPDPNIFYHNDCGSNFANTSLAGRHSHIGDVCIGIIIT